MRHRCNKSRRISRWRNFNFFNKKENYLENSIHNLTLWYLSGKLNWIEFYIWLQNNKGGSIYFLDQGWYDIEWKPVFVHRSEKIHQDIGFYLYFISNIPKYSGFEIYNNHILYIDLIVNVLQKPATLFRYP